MDEVTKEDVQKMLQSPSARSRFSRLPLILKIGTGYAVMAVFTIAALVFSAYNLYQINTSAREIGNVQLPVLNALIKLRSSLLIQENFAGKYGILRDPAFIELFRQRDKKSIANLAVLERGESVRDSALLRRLYLEYQSAAEEVFAGKSGVTALERRLAAQRLLTVLDTRYVNQQEMLQAVLKHADERQKTTIRLTIWVSCIGFLLTIWVAPLVTLRIFGALEKLQKATHRIAGGDFSFTPQLPQQAELSDLACDFSQMADRLKELEQMNDDAVPLTRLPGNLAIERVLDERLQAGLPFAFCCANLVNFKPFSARYGYAKASELLRATGFVIFRAVHEHGSPKDFAGHVGGDDFVMVVSADKAAEVCEAVIQGFDAEVANHFTPEERQAGGIVRCDSHGAKGFFPITTISISVLDCAAGEYATAVEIAGAAADLGDFVAETPGSNWRAVSRSLRAVELVAAPTLPEA